MLRFLLGFCCGVYTGTYYNLKPYVDKLVKTIKDFEKNAKK